MSQPGSEGLGTGTGTQGFGGLTSALTLRATLGQHRCSTSWFAGSSQSWVRPGGPSWKGFGRLSVSHPECPDALSECWAQVFPRDAGRLPGPGAHGHGRCRRSWLGINVTPSSRLVPPLAVLRESLTLQAGVLVTGLDCVLHDPLCSSGPSHGGRRRRSFSLGVSELYFEWRDHLPEPSQGGVATTEEAGDRLVRAFPTPEQEGWTCHHDSVPFPVGRAGRRGLLLNHGQGVAARAP